MVVLKTLVLGAVGAVALVVGAAVVNAFFCSSWESPFRDDRPGQGEDTHGPDCC